MAKDFYKILGVPHNATDEEIKHAYRRLAQRHHPDRNKENKEAEAKFKEINNAYEILSDKRKRDQYDQFGTVNEGANFGRGFQESGFDFSNFGESFSDIFESFFGGAQPRNKKRNHRLKGEDIEFNLAITFEEAAFGCEKTLEITKYLVCERCEGNGFERDTKIIICANCNGTGEVRSVQNTILGQISSSRLCGTCHGEGRIPEKNCSICHGDTRIRGTEKVIVKIPAGIDNNSTIRLSGKGQAGIKNGNYGDLYIHVSLLNHKIFTRKGYDVYSDERIDLLQAVLGDEVTVSTLHGQEKIILPTGTQSGTVFRLKNKGIAHLRNNQLGDHYVKFEVEIPKKLTKLEYGLYQELAKEKGLQIKNSKKGWLF